MAKPVSAASAQHADDIKASFPFRRWLHHLQGPEIMDNKGQALITAAPIAAKGSETREDDYLGLRA